MFVYVCVLKYICRQIDRQSRRRQKRIDEFHHRRANIMAVGWLLVLERKKQKNRRYTSAFIVSLEKGKRWKSWNRVGPLVERLDWPYDLLGFLPCSMSDSSERKGLSFRVPTLIPIELGNGRIKNKSLISFFLFFFISFLLLLFSPFFSLRTI